MKTLSTFLTSNAKRCTMLILCSTRLEQVRFLSKFDTLGMVIDPSSHYIQNGKVDLFCNERTCIEKVKKDVTNMNPDFLISIGSVKSHISNTKENDIFLGKSFLENNNNENEYYSDYSLNAICYSNKINENINFVDVNSESILDETKKNSEYYYDDVEVSIAKLCNNMDIPFLSILNSNDSDDYYSKIDVAFYMCDMLKSMI